jgi:hypothetical protein
VRRTGDLATKNTPKPKTAHVNAHVSGKICIVGTIKGHRAARNRNIARRRGRHTTPISFSSYPSFFLNAHHQTPSRVCLTGNEPEARANLGKAMDQGSSGDTPGAPGIDLGPPDLAAGGWKRPASGAHGRGSGGHGRGGARMAARIDSDRGRGGLNWGSDGSNRPARPEQDQPEQARDKDGLNGGQIPSSRSILRKKMTARILHRERWNLPE